MIGPLNIALTGLESASKRLQASASNIANLQTVGALEGDPAPYTPLTTRQTSQEHGGVSTHYVPKGEPYYALYSPDSPFANEQGIIGVPNIDLAEEAVNMQIAKVTYKANIAAIKVAEDLSDELLRVLDRKA